MAGYLIAWLAYSIGAASLQLVLQRAGMLRHATASVTSGLGAAVFLFAGLYQFAPIKRACLTHCRTPLGYFLSRWHDGPPNGFRLGINHGLFCVGCCWALMATSFAVGIMNVWWMVTLAALAVAEQVAPHGHRLRVPLGVGFMIAGVWQYSRLTTAVATPLPSSSTVAGSGTAVVSTTGVTTGASRSWRLAPNVTKLETDRLPPLKSSSSSAPDASSE